MALNADFESSLWSRFQPASPAIRVGVLSGAGGIEAWLSSLLHSLVAQARIEISALFLMDELSPDLTPPRLFRNFENWSRAGSQDWFDISDSLPASIPRHKLSGGPGDKALISAEKVDVLLCATPFSLTGDCTDLVRFGVWSILLGEPEYVSCRPPLWREVSDGRTVSRAFLLDHKDRFERGRVIESLATATVGSLRFTRNRDAPLKGVASALGRALTRVRESGGSPFGGEEIELHPGSARWPSAIETTAFLCGKLGRSAILRAKARNKKLQWSIGIRRATGDVELRNPLKGAPFLEVAMPPGHYYADPFIIESDSRHWLFFEDWFDSDSRGRLACLEVTGQGVAGEPVLILDRPYHLSYPHVFSHRGEFFMIPETCGNESVQLYRSTRFPFEWELECFLMEGVALVDTTAFFYDGDWYFFTSTATEPEEAYLFTSKSLGGPWRYHPANPIGTDTRRVRGAGSIFVNGGTLVRPAQDCSTGYGAAVTFNEIHRLSLTEYEERQAGGFGPAWAPGLHGAHTFNRDSTYEVVDGQRLVPIARY